MKMWKICKIFVIFIALNAALLAKENPLDIESIFDSSKITLDDKPIMLIFGKNDCYYCDILTASLVSNDTIEGYITLNFGAYYINIDDKKKHSISFLNLSRASSLEVAKIYDIKALPMIIFIAPDKSEIMRVVGFPGEARIINLLEFVNNDIWKNYPSKNERIQGFLEYEKEIRK